MHDHGVAPTCGSLAPVAYVDNAEVSAKSRLRRWLPCEIKTVCEILIWHGNSLPCCAGEIGAHAVWFKHADGPALGLASICLSERRRTATSSGGLLWRDDSSVKRRRRGSSGGDRWWLLPTEFLHFVLNCFCGTLCEIHVGRNDDLAVDGFGPLGS